jgi:hypothetical protein
MPTEPLRRAVRAARPGSETLTPIYVEPVRLNMATLTTRIGR